MNENVRFEILAEVFRLATGVTAPGKCQSPAAFDGVDLDERWTLFRAFDAKHGTIARLAIDTTERQLREQTETDE